MNSFRHQPFLYSLFIHLLLALLVFALYYAKAEREHEKYSQLDLKSLRICTPTLQQSPSEKPLPPACQCAAEPKEEKKVQKKLKKVQKREREPQPEISKTEALLAVNKESLQEQKQEVSEAEAEEEDVQEEESTALAKLQPQESPAPSELVSEPELSYEARYMQDNIALINALIKQNLNYPRLAKKRGLQGKAIVSFTINTKGEVTGIEASGEAAAILKKSALKTIEKASTSFPHPETTLALQIPIVYKLN